ncbi:MAG: YeeE/YedE thiosulfate transporter family protein [Fulvivirga sp.]|uniref:YeeE/YedE family protein n=1 Tax=Fulvivirga sp. TaxID=1931237 RepID=UPI0032ECB51D
MKELVEVVSEPWPWYVAGSIIALVMFMLLYLGNTFGISSNLRTVCSIFGAGKNCEYFDFHWRAQTWNLIFASGMMIGGFIAANWLSTDSGVRISTETILELKNYGIENPGNEIVPETLFSWESLLTFKGIIMLVVGGFLVGFGTRYAGGCTSGHAISGLSALQWPSLIAVIGFFIGGLFVTYLVLPHLLAL